MSEYRKRNRGIINAGDIEWRHANHDKVNAWVSRYRMRNKKKKAAQLLAERHVPLDISCSKCGSTVKLERHHFDYSKPLDVVTLCRKCHNLISNGE